MQQPAHWVMDYETMVNLFVAVFIHYKTDEKKIFLIHESQDDFPEFLMFLERNQKQQEWHISFNGLSFDSQISEFILRNKSVLSKTSTQKRIQLIYDKAQQLINRARNEWPEWPEWDLKIKQIDVFKVNHWDNANKSSSLKWLQCSIDWPNVQDMPYPHDMPMTTSEQIQEVVEYCCNDVLSTKKILHLSKPLLDVRYSIKKKYGLNCYNYSNTKLGSELLLQMYCNATGRFKKDVKQFRTERPQIILNDIIFPYIQFQTPQLVEFLKMLKGRVITNTKNGFEYELKYKGYTFYYGAGGIHQCIQKGIYKEDDEWIIKDLDVASLYPSIACQNGMYPAHLGPDFFRIYKHEIVDVRLTEKAKPKAERDMAIIEGFKEAANATYGNSNSQFSWLYDPQYTMQTTINGQLLITMLVEDLLLNIPEAQLLQTNTDGATLRFKKKYQSVYDGICQRWEQLTKLTLEFADYKAMYIWDVNNYFAVKTDGTAKCKGRFEWEDLENHKYTHLHKNKSYLIIPKAIFNYFVNDIVPERYLAENRNIYHYCAQVKIKGNWAFHETCIVNGEVMGRTLQKTLRYYVSKNGCKVIKKNLTDGREIQLESGKWLTTNFCKFVDMPWEKYQVNEAYYLEQIYKEIHALVPLKTTQLKLEL